MAILCAATVTACGSDDTDEDSGTPGGATRLTQGGSGNPGAPECTSFPLASGTAGEKTNAALCFGLADDGGDVVGCQYNAVGDFTHCETSSYWYEVDWYVSGGTTYGEIYGANFPSTTGATIATVYQGTNGSFRYVDPDTGDEMAYCTVVGDVANLCIWP